MFGSNTLEVAIGIIFVFILVSTICTAVREGIEGWLKTRAAYLEHGIRQLLKDPAGKGIAKDLYEHPLVFGLFNGAYKPGKNNVKPALFARGDDLPSYIPSSSFAIALMDIAARGPVKDEISAVDHTTIVSLDAIRQNVGKMKNAYVQRMLVNAVDTSQGDLDKVQASIEAWYNSSMDRVSGWYKRSTQLIIFFIALIIAVGININCIKIANYIAHNDTAQKVILEKADAAAKDTATVSYKEAQKDLSELDIPIGWNKGVDKENNWNSLKLNDNANDRSLWNLYIGALLGWLITAFAATLGAPFWFDMLNKVMVIRSTVKPNEKSPDEASQDKQAPVPKVIYAAAPPVASVKVNDVPDEPDGCNILTTKFTADEDLPESKGGIA